jgi:hypothetical protein
MVWYMIADALRHKYQPQDTMTRVELCHQLNKVTMKKGDGPPTLLLEQIRTDKHALTRMIEKEDLTAVVIDAAPQEYQSVLVSEQL